MVEHKFFEDICDIFIQKDLYEKYLESEGCLDTYREANFVRLMNFLGFQWGSTLKRNTKRIKFLKPVEWEGDNRGIQTQKTLYWTTPDFVIKLPNSSDVFIEFKGKMIGSDSVRIREALKVNHNYWVITGAILKEWGAIYGEIIPNWT